MPKFRNFDHIFTIWGTLVPILFTDLSQIWQEIVDPQSMLTCQISSESICCVTFRGWKTAILAKVWHLGGSCTQPLYYLHAKFRLDQFILSYSCSKKSQILLLWGFSILWCCQLAAYGESWMWVHNYKPSPIQRFQDRFYVPMTSWQNHAHNSIIQKHDGQTDKKLNVFGCPGGRWSPSPTKLGMVIRGPRARSCSSKMFGGPTYSFAARGTENLGELHSLNLKPHNSITFQANPSKF